MNRTADEEIQRVEGMAHTGNSSIRFDNTTIVGVYQIFDIDPGLMAARAYYYTPTGTETEGFARIVVTVRDTNGSYLLDYISDERPLSNTSGEWSSVKLLQDIPPTINGKEVGSVLVNAQIWHARDAEVYVDDVLMYQ